MASARRRITVVIEALNGFVDRLIKKLVLDVVANLVRAGSEGGTPVDTGWARANWVPNIGAPLTVPAGTRPTATGGALPGDQQLGLAKVVTTYKQSQGAVFISNNVPYILSLNEGSSSQAPKGFVQSAIAEAVKVV